MHTDWTEVGKEHSGTPAKRAHIRWAIDSMEWHHLEKGKTTTLCMMAGMGIKAAIRALRLPNVTDVSVSNELAPFGLYGVRCQYENAMVNVYIVDEGCECFPVCMDVWEFPETKTA